MLIRFLRLNCLFFLFLNLISYLVAAMVSNTFIPPVSHFAFPAIFFLFGFGALSFFAVILNYLWLYLCFYLMYGEMESGMGGGFLQFFAFVISIVIGAVILPNLNLTDGLLFFRDIAFGFFFSTILNSEFATTPKK